MIHEICKNCKWEQYPICLGTVIDGINMNIENLHTYFTCGVKDSKEQSVTYITTMAPGTKSLQTVIEELVVKIGDIENRITSLENK